MQRVNIDRGFTTRGHFFCRKKRRGKNPPPFVLQIDFRVKYDGMALQFSLKHAVVQKR